MEGRRESKVFLLWEVKVSYTKVRYAYSILFFIVRAFIIVLARYPENIH